MRAAAEPVVVLIAATVACAGIVAGAMAAAPMLGAALADWPQAAQEATFALILYGALALVAVVGRRLAGVTAARRGSPPVWTAIGAAIGIGGLLIALCYAALAGLVVVGGGAAGAAALVIGTLAVVGQSASEELFFRGWIQPLLVPRWGPVAGIAATAIAFAGLHVMGGLRTPLTLVNLALGGALFGLLAWRSDGLAAPIAAHAGWNWAETILFGLDPNPGVGGYGAIHDLDLAGAARWGGSAEGLNASVAMTLVLVALIVPLATEAVRARRPAAAMTPRGSSSGRD